jgi:hypothetical protein
MEGLAHPQFAAKGGVCCAQNGRNHDLQGAAEKCGCEGCSAKNFQSGHKQTSTTPPLVKAHYKHARTSPGTCSRRGNRGQGGRAAGTRLHVGVAVLVRSQGVEVQHVAPQALQCRQGWGHQTIRLKAQQLNPLLLSSFVLSDHGWREGARCSAAGRAAAAQPPAVQPANCLTV